MGPTPTPTGPMVVMSRAPSAGVKWYSRTKSRTPSATQLPLRLAQLTLRTTSLLPFTSPSSRSVPKATRMVTTPTPALMQTVQTPALASANTTAAHGPTDSKATTPPGTACRTTTRTPATQTTNLTKP